MGRKQAEISNWKSQISELKTPGLIHGSRIGNRKSEIANPELRNAAPGPDHLNRRRNLSSTPTMPFGSRTPRSEIFSPKAYSNWII